MKIISALLIALALQAETHHFKVVYFNDITLTDVALVLNDDNHTFSVWHKGSKLSDEFMIINCGHKADKFCMVIKQEQFYGDVR